MYTYGDSKSAKTWSNIPFFLTTTLEEKGYIVHRINIQRFKFVQRVFNKICRMVNQDTGMEFQRLGLNAKLVNRIMRKSLRKFPNADLLISTNFSYSPSSVCTTIPSILLCDWTLEYLIRHFKRREPSYWEEREIKRQDKEIEKSDYVVTLFPRIKEDMDAYYKTNNIYYLGNVLNTAINPENNVDIAEKYRNRKILFIGQKKYLDSLLVILEAIKSYNDNSTQTINLDIIGMNSAPGMEKYENVEYYGYLDKTDELERKLYYRLMSEASICINTSDNWGGFSSIVEALYFYTPVITSRYSEFVETFGEEIPFGVYCNNNTEEIESAFRTILDNDEEKYCELCQQSHCSVEQFTWGGYVERLIDLVGEK